MDAKEKAKELLLKFWIKADIDKVGAYMDKVLAKQCAIICVDEIIDYIGGWDYEAEIEFNDESKPHQTYWESVKEEINNL